jgi:hypothetical protein
MEVEMIARLTENYHLIDFGAVVSYDFYHLEHVNPRMHGRRHVKKNPPMHDLYRSAKTGRMLNPNGDQWGLAPYYLEVLAAVRSPDNGRVSRESSTGAFVLLIVRLGLQILVDNVLLEARAVRGRCQSILYHWAHRGALARQTIRGLPLGKWPQALKARWKARKADQFVFQAEIRNVDSLEPRNRE